MLFGENYSAALNDWDGHEDDFAQWIFDHPTNIEPTVAQYRLSKVLSQEDIELLRTTLPVQVDRSYIGRSLHSALAHEAEIRPDCAAATKFLNEFENILPLEGPDGLWSRMALEGGTIRSIASCTHRSTGRKLRVRVVFDRQPSTEHVQNELAQFVIDGDGATCHLMIGLPGGYAPRLLATFPFIIPYLECSDLDGAFDLSLGDEAVLGRVLGFSSQLKEFLVPDIMFIGSHGYAEARELYVHSRSWYERADLAYWRGTDTGVFRYRNIDDAPRVAISKLSLRNSDMIDAKITDVERRPNWETKLTYYQAENLIGEPEPQSRILDYKYQIDIDGNTNTWSSLFLKLLTGSPVLKIESELGFKQWYYELLVPWVNYIPVSPDLSDMIERINWLRENSDKAYHVGQKGRELALSINFESAIASGRSAVENLVRLNKRTLILS